MAENKTPALKRSIGLWSAVAINVGAIIGGGIFVVTGIVAGYAGSAFIISMIAAGIIAFITATSFSKLTAWQPVEGGAYEYGRQLVSPYAGFLAGWMWLVANTFTGAAVSLGFVYYLSAAIPGLPVNVVAAVMCLVFTALNLVGAKESAAVNNIFVAIKLSVLAFFVVFGALFADTTNFAPFTPLSSGVLYATFFIFFAYGGFARVTVIAEEIKDAKRNVPRALLLSLGLSMLVYVSVGLVAVGLLGADGLGGSASPLSEAMAVSGSSVAVQVISFGGLVATASVLLTAILGVSRMAYSMARRHDLPNNLAQLHGRFCTPFKAIIGTGVVMAVLVLFLDLTRVVAISTFALVFNYCIVNISAFKLQNGSGRFRRILPLLGLGTCLMLLAFILFATPEVWVAGVVFLAVGTAYFLVQKHLRGRKRVLANQTNSKVTSAG
ncbi:MAG: APC family permease [Candidatus Bathyarchaeota archaeon]|nr:APC family permease [Candidatus Bathyarchaeota archaeon]